MHNFIVQSLHVYCFSGTFWKTHLVMLVFLNKYYYQSIIINQSFSQPSLWTHFIKIYSPISNEHGSIYLIDCHIWLVNILTNYSLLSLAFYVHNRLILLKYFPVLRSWDKWLSVPWGRKIVMISLAYGPHIVKLFLLSDKLVVQWAITHWPLHYIKIALWPVTT